MPIAESARSARTVLPLLIAFVDLSGFAADAARTDEPRLAEVLDDLYERVAARVEAAGGLVVKFMGDAALIVFDAEDADRGTLALLELKREVDRVLAEARWSSRLVVKAHFGPVVAGPYGARGAKRFDVLGKAVNVAATLETRSFALSAEAFRRLSPGTRTLFKKHTSPVTYLPLDAPRP